MEGNEEKKPMTDEEELERIEKLAEKLDNLPLDKMADSKLDAESIDKIGTMLPALANLIQPKEQYNHVSYSAKLAISKYQNHQISFGMRIPVNGNFYKAFAEVMTKCYQFHEAILAFRHLSQHVIGLKSERRTLLGHINRNVDTLEKHKARLIELTDKAPGKDADLIHQAEHQKNLLCEREGIDDQEKRIEEEQKETMELWTRIVKYTNHANDLGECIKAGLPETWDQLPEQFKIPLEEGHKQPGYEHKGLAKQYHDYENDDYYEGRRY